MKYILCLLISLSICFSSSTNSTSSNTQFKEAIEETEELEADIEETEKKVNSSVVYNAVISAHYLKTFNEKIHTVKIIKNTDAINTNKGLN